MFAIQHDDYDFECNGDSIPHAACVKCGHGSIAMAPLAIVDSVGRPLCDACARQLCPVLFSAWWFIQQSPDRRHAIGVLLTARAEQLDEAVAQ